MSVKFNLSQIAFLNVSFPCYQVLYHLYHLSLDASSVPLLSERYRLLTASNSTTVTVNCNTFSQPQTFSSCQLLLVVLSPPNPLLHGDGVLSGRETDEVSDPFMMMTPSVNQYTNDYIFHSHYMKKNDIRSYSDSLSKIMQTL